VIGEINTLKKEGLPSTWPNLSPGPLCPSNYGLAQAKRTMDLGSSY